MAMNPTATQVQLWRDNRGTLCETEVAANQLSATNDVQDFLDTLPDLVGINTRDVAHSLVSAWNMVPATPK